MKVIRIASWIAVIGMVCAAGMASAQTRVLLAHIAPFAEEEATSVSITITDGTGTEVVDEDDLEYGDFTEYLDIPDGAGEYLIEVTQTGASDPSVSRNQSLADNTDYTIAFIGDGDSQLTEFTLLVLTDDNSETDAGFGRTRIVHGAPFSSTLDGTRVSVRTDDGDVIVEDLPYPQNTGFLALEVGTYDLKIANVDGSENLIDPEPVELEDGDIVTFFATGDGSNQDLGVLAIPGGFLPLEDPVDLSFSGSWFNPDTNGQGFSIEAVPSGDRLLVYWFTFNAEGTAQAWYTADTSGEGGSFKDNVATMTVFETTGGKFDDSDATATTTAVGTLTIEFTSCDTGNAEYDIMDDSVEGDLEGSFDIERITPVVNCTATFDDVDL